MSKKRTALISGATGQDASLLARLLLSRGWQVIAFRRHVQSPDMGNIQDLLDHPNYILETGDVTDSGSIVRLLAGYQPEHFYHLAANSFVGCSWNEPIAVFDTNATGTLRCLEAVRTCSPRTRFLFASTSETVGNSAEPIQDEDTPHTPRSPYAASKAAGEHLVKIYRDSHKLFCCFTRCFNHESQYRGKEFVTRKITSYIGESYKTIISSGITIASDESLEQTFNRALKLGIIKLLRLGNLDSHRDWLAAEDCVRGMTMVLDAESPDDYVLASGQMHSIRDFLRTAFGVLGIVNFEPFIVQDPAFFRPHDVVTLCGNYSKAKRQLGWEPQISFEKMVRQMVYHDAGINQTGHICYELVQ